MLDERDEWINEAAYVERIFCDYFVNLFIIKALTRTN